MVELQCREAARIAAQRALAARLGDEYFLHPLAATADRLRATLETPPPAIGSPGEARVAVVHAVPLRATARFLSSSPIHSTDVK